MDLGSLDPLRFCDCAMELALYKLFSCDLDPGQHNRIFL